MSGYVRQAVDPTGWKDLGVISVADVAWATTEFASSVVEAIVSTTVLLAVVPSGAVNLDFRFYGTATDADSDVINIYGKRNNDDYYQLIATLTLTTGTAQKGAATELWKDTCVETVDATPQASGAPISPADNTIARYSFKPSGFKQLAIIATTLNATDVGVEMASFSG